MLANIPRLMTRVLRRASRRIGRRAARLVRHVGASRDVAELHVQRGAHPRDHAGDLRVPRAAGDRRPALSRHRHARALGVGVRDSALEVLAANDVDVMIDDARRLHADARRLARDSHLQPRSHDRARRRHRRHAVAQSARGRRLQVQPAERRSGRHGRHAAGFRIAPTRCSRTISHGVRRMPFARARSARRRRTATTTSTRTSPTSRSVIDIDAIRGAHALARRRSARRRRRALLGRDRRALRAAAHGRERRRRSDVPLHDASTGTARFAWTARRRTRCSASSGCRIEFDVAWACDPDHDRHGIVARSVGTAESQSLSRGRDRLSLRASAGVVGARPASARRS